jgi:hypothetical protein
MNNDSTLGAWARLSTPSEMPELFAVASPLDVTNISGLYRVGLLSALGLDQLPKRIRPGFMRWLNQAMPGVYLGKRFDAQGGANVFVGDHPALPFKWVGRAGSAVFSYDTPATPRPARRLVGEIRDLGDGTYLCRTSTAKGRTLLYFTLTPPRRQ